MWAIKSTGCYRWRECFEVFAANISALSRNKSHRDDIYRRTIVTLLQLPPKQTKRKRLWRLRNPLPSLLSFSATNSVTTRLREMMGDYWTSHLATAFHYWICDCLEKVLPQTKIWRTIVSKAQKFLKKDFLLKYYDWNTFDDVYLEATLPQRAFLSWKSTQRESITIDWLFSVSRAIKCK